MLVDERRVGRKALFQIDDRIDRIDVDDDIANRIFRHVAVVGHDHRDGLADMADLVFCERQLCARR